MICNLGVVGSTPSIGSEKFFYKRIFAEAAKSDAEKQITVTDFLKFIFCEDKEVE